MHFSNMPAGNKQKTQIVTVTPLVRKSKGRAGNTMHYYLLRAWRQRGTTDDDGERNVTKNEIIKDVARRRESERAVNATVVRLLIYCAHAYLRHTSETRVNATYKIPGKAQRHVAFDCASPTACSSTASRTACSQRVLTRELQP